MTRGEDLGDRVEKTQVYLYFEYRPFQVPEISFSMSPSANFAFEWNKIRKLFIVKRAKGLVLQYLRHLVIQQNNETKKGEKKEEETMKMMGDFIRGRSLYLSFLSIAVNAEFRTGMPEG